MVLYKLWRGPGNKHRRSRLLERASVAYGGHRQRLGPEWDGGTTRVLGWGGDQQFCWL